MVPSTSFAQSTWRILLSKEFLVQQRKLIVFVSQPKSLCNGEAPRASPGGRSRTLPLPQSQANSSMDLLTVFDVPFFPLSPLALKRTSTAFYPAPLSSSGVYLATVRKASAALTPVRAVLAVGLWGSWGSILWQFDGRGKAGDKANCDRLMSGVMQQSGSVTVWTVCFQSKTGRL